MYRFWYSKYFESVKMELEQKENKILGIKVKITTKKILQNTKPLN